MSKDNKTENIVIIGIIVITLLEIYFAYRVLVKYKGIYQISIFIPLLLQPFIYAKLLKRDISHYKIRLSILLLVSVLLPLTIYLTLPEYSYDQGKEIVKKSFEQEENIDFLDLAFNYKKIPAVNNPKGIFIADRVYYYKTVSAGNEEYFIVNPITGELGELSEDYWTKEE